MPQGTLEVLLVGAKDLDDNDFFGKMDTCVLLSLRTQEKRSSMAQGQGSTPEWNETFQFTVSTDDVTDLSLKIMDKDTFTPDDFVGEATIPLQTVFKQGSTELTKYNVVNKNNEYHGDITVGLTFTREGGTGSRAGGYDENEYGGRQGGSRRTQADDSISDDDNSMRGGHGNSRERHGGGDDTDSRRGSYGNSTERHAVDHDSRRGGYGNSRCDDDESGGGYSAGESRGRSGGRRESHEEESYGGYRESSYRG